MISIQMTIAEAIAIANTAGNDLHDRIVNALEAAIEEKESKGGCGGCSVTITGGMNTNNRISCIKAIRLATGWGLKESKDWTDVIVGRYDASGHWVCGGSDNTMTLKSPEFATALLMDLKQLGCKGFIS